MPKKVTPDLKATLKYCSFGQYRNRELKRLEFSSLREFRRAIVALWEDPDLRALPYDTVDGETLLIPAEAVPFMRRKGFRFKTSQPLAIGDLPRREQIEIRKKYSM